MELYEEFTRGECSLGYLAEQLGITSWEAYELLEKKGVTNLKSLEFSNFELVLRDRQALAGAIELITEYTAARRASKREVLYPRAR
jgi:hypothetical protein